MSPTVEVYLFAILAIWLATFLVSYFLGVHMGRATAPAKPWVNRGREFIHRKWGRVMAISVHPHDGATWIIERQETTDPDDDDLVLDSCERSDLVEAEQQDQWPYLGFTARSK